MDIGTGLGLTTVCEIIKGREGIIGVYGEKGQGTNFNINLPVSEKMVIAPNKPAEVTMGEGKGTILLIDDEDMIREVVSGLLESLGYRILKADSGAEAVKIYQTNQNNIDLVILDMIMPGISGSETFDLLKVINPAVKVILSSGYSQNDMAASILERGCLAFIQKPFSIKDISAKIQEVMKM